MKRARSTHLIGSGVAAPAVCRCDHSRNHQARQRAPGPALGKRRIWSCAALVAVLLAGASHAQAHQGSITHATARIGPDQTTVEYSLLMSPPDVAELIGLAPDTDPADADVARGGERILDHVRTRVAILDGEVPCPAERGEVGLTQHGGRFVEVAWRARCPAPIRQLVIRYDLFFDLDPMHRGLLNVRYRGETAVAELREGRNRFVWDLDAPPPSGLSDFLASGIEHIVLGFDHLAFLLALLLIIVIRRADDESWQPRDMHQALRETALLVTSFTVAHTLTLITASLGWITMDSRVVESVIAASIVYVAIENVIRPGANRRFVLTFAFGLVHGFGFASILRELLPSEGVLLPLLMFNLGVELGQLAVIVLVMPALQKLVQAMGARPYRRLLMPAISGLLAAIGMIWLVERAFAITLLGL